MCVYTCLCTYICIYTRARFPCACAMSFDFCKTTIHVHKISDYHLLFRWYSRSYTVPRSVPIDRLQLSVARSRYVASTSVELYRRSFNAARRTRGRGSALRKAVMKKSDAEMSSVHSSLSCICGNAAEMQSLRSLVSTRIPNCK